MTIGSRAEYAKPRNEPQLKKNHLASGDFPKSGPTSTAWVNRKQMEIQRGNQGNLARDTRMAQENLLTARLDEEKQISELTTNRRASLIGEVSRARHAQQAAAQVLTTK